MPSTGLQRTYRLVVGALGENGHGNLSQHTIVIDSAECIAVAGSSTQHALTSIWVLSETDEPLGIVSGSTEMGMSSDVSADQGGFVFNPIVDANIANLGPCPASVVIQASDGTITVAPLVRVSWPSIPADEWAQLQSDRRYH